MTKKTEKDLEKILSESAENLIQITEGTTEGLDEGKDCGCDDDKDTADGEVVDHDADDKKDTLKAKAKDKIVKEDADKEVEETEAETDSEEVVVENEDVAAMFKGADLSEDFKAKATTIFEAAISLRVKEKVEALEEAAQKEIDARIAKLDETYATQIDDYLTYAVNEWMNENKLAVETGLRAEIAESFIDDLAALFEKHNIFVPAEKIDIAEKLQVEVDDVKKELAEQIEKNIALGKEIFAFQKKEVLARLSEGLVLTQSEKLNKLAEDIDASSIAAFEDKVKIIKESYFTESADENKSIETVKETITESNDPMVALKEKLKKINKKD